MRLRFHSTRLYLDFEWGLARNEPHPEPPPPGPAVHIGTPMTAYEPVKVGFRTTGPGEGFTTGDV